VGPCLLFCVKAKQHGFGYFFITAIRILLSTCGKHVTNFPKFSSHGYCEVALGKAYFSTLEHFPLLPLFLLSPLFSHPPTHLHRKTHTLCITIGIHSDKCTVRWFLLMPNNSECTYTYLDGQGHSLIVAS
jgi:hypothetical protein